MSDAKAAQPHRDYQPNYERQAITDQEIWQLRMTLVEEGNSSCVRICDRALAGDVSAVNACKAMIHGLD